jgi:hypothetical protein
MDDLPLGHAARDHGAARMKPIFAAETGEISHDP